MESLQITPTIDAKSARLIKPLQTTNAIKQDGLGSQEEKIQKAAQGFERTLVRQMLSIVRSTNIRGGEPPSTTTSGYMEMLDDKRADQLTEGNGLGFATAMAQQLMRQIDAKNINALNNNAVNTISTSLGGTN